jgi:aspartyl/asparaginyl-tRNA synthetase
VHTSRHTKDKVWILLRQNIELIQGFVMVTKGQVSKQMAKWIGDLTPETVVLVEGLTQKPQDGPVLSATVQNVEIFVTKVRFRGFMLFDLNPIFSFFLSLALRHRRSKEETSAFQSRRRLPSRERIRKGRFAL